MPPVRSADGTGIYCEVDGAGAPLVLCTASFSTHLHWEGVRPALGRHCRTAAWDYRGHGRSGAPADDSGWSLERFLEDLAAVHEEPSGVRRVNAGEDLSERALAGPVLPK